MGFPGGYDGRPRHGRPEARAPGAPRAQSPAGGRPPAVQPPGSGSYRPVPTGPAGSPDPPPRGRADTGATLAPYVPGAPSRGGAAPSEGIQAGGGLAARGAAARTGSPRRRGPIRGYPPMPGQPGPVYPPGQFAAWNRPSVRASWLGQARPDDTSWDEPGYPILATSDPSADETTTQTWAAIDDAGGWSPPPPRADLSSHTDGNGFSAIRAPRGSRNGPPARAPWESGSQPATGPSTGPFAAAAASASPPARAPWEPGSQPATGPSTTGPLAAAAPTTGSVFTRTGQGRPGASAPTGASSAQPARWDSASLPAAGRGGRHGQRAPADNGEHGRRASRTGRPAAPGPRRTSGHSRLSHRTLAGLLMAPVVVVILIVAAYVYISSRPVTPVVRAAPSHPAAAPGSPAPSLGPWKHIEARAVDPLPLSLTELYPARFAAGGSAGVRTVDKAVTRCTQAVIGSALKAAVRKAGCTQVLRASYLSTNRKMMATIGVLNLVDVAAAEKVGRASGATEFIRQLPARHGPTHNLTSGTGLEEAAVKGHYLILIWAEFANRHAPSGKKQRTQLANFSSDLVTGTANVSLSRRMVTGKPQTP